MWRRPLEWNLNGTTDPRDGSVDHLSLNSLKDRHGPIRAPKSDASKGRARRPSDSHLRVVWASAALRGRPGDILGGVLDIAGLAVDAVLRVDHEARVRLRRLVVVHDFVHAGGTVEARWLSELRQVVADRNV